MSCLVNRNQRGEITQVITKDGMPSKLFEQVHANPFLGDANFSLKVMTLLSKTKSNDTYETGEPKLFYKVGENEMYEDLEDVFVAGKEGQIAMGVKNEKGEFVPSLTFSTNSSPVSSFISSQIGEGVIEARRVLTPDGKTHFVGKGEFQHVKKTTAEIFARSVLESGLSGNVKVNETEGTVEVKFPPKGVLFETTKGTFDEIPIEEIPQRLAEIENKGEALAIYYESKEVDNKVIQTEELGLLGSTLTSFLQTLGFSSTTLENYQKRFRTVFGQDPDIQALSDLANRVVAFANGQITAENLSEEVAHIALEAYADQESIAEQLANVHLTDEYAQYAEYYRQKYSPFHEGIELEDKVRKEILGKMLGKVLQNKFQETKPEAVTIANALVDIFNMVMGYIRSKMRPSHIQRMNDLNERIAEEIIRNDLGKFNKNLNNSTDFFYSASSSRVQEILRDLKDARRQFEDTRIFDPAIAFEQESLRRIGDATDIYGTIEGAMTIVGIFDRKVKDLETAVRTMIQRNEKGLSSESRQNAINLKENLADMVAQIEQDLKDLVKNGKSKYGLQDNEIKFLSKRVDEISYIAREASENLRQVYPILDKELEGRAEEFLEEALENAPNMNEDDVNRVREQFHATRDTPLRDISKVTGWFHFLSKSSNPVLGLLFTRVQNMYQSIVHEFTNSTSDFVTNAVNKGWEKFDRNVIKRVDGQATEWLRGVIDKDAYYKALDKVKADTISTLTGKDATEIQKLRDSGKTDYEILENEQNIKKYQEALQNFYDDNRNHRDSKIYRQKKREKQERQKLSERTVAFLSEISGQRAAIVQRALNKVDGTVDYTLLTDAEKQRLEDLKNRKARQESPFDFSNEMREGIQIRKASQLTTQEIDFLEERGIDTKQIKPDTELVLPKNVADIDNLPTDSRIAVDLNVRNYAFRFPQSTEESAQTNFNKFIDKLKSFGDNRKAYEWAQANMTSALSNEYYDSITEDASFSNQVERYLRDLPDGLEKTVVEQNFIAWQRANSKRRNLLKQNRKMRQPLEVNVGKMSTPTKAALLELEAEMSMAKKAIDLPEAYQVESNLLTERKPNSDFFAESRQQGFAPKDLWQFAIKNMTETNKKTVLEFRQQLEELLQGRRLKMNNNFEKIFMEMVSGGLSVDPSKTTSDEVLSEATNRLAMDRMASYMYTIAPKGYDAVMEALESGELSIVDILEGRVTQYEVEEDEMFDLNFLAFRPDYTWIEEEDTKDRLNPHYNSDLYYMQPNEKYIDMETAERYGYTVQDVLNANFDIQKIKATKNVEEFEYLKAVYKMRQETYNYSGNSTTKDPQLRPPISQTLTEKLTPGGIRGLATNLPQNVKEFLKEAVQNREDEMMYGEEVKTSKGTLRVIPKLFQRRLKNPAEITESTTSAILLERREAIVYNQRVEANNDVVALMNHIKQQDFVEAGTFSKRGKTKIVKGEVTNQYQQAQEFVDNAIYGVQQATKMSFEVAGQEVNLTKAIHWMQRMSTFMNLGFSPFVAATSGTTGFLNRLIYQGAQEDISTKSMVWAEKKALKASAQYTRNLGRLDANSELQTILEYFGLEDVQERVSESSAGRVGRITKSTPFLMDKLANLVLKPQIVYGLLRDYQAYQKPDGKTVFVNFRQYRNMEIAKGVDLKTIETTWNNRAESGEYSLYDFLEIGGGKIKFKISDKISEKLMRDTMARVAAQAQDLTMKIDGTVPDGLRTAAQRNVFTNAMLQHQSWFVILLSRKFAKEHYNFSTGQYDQGEYRNSLSFIWQTLKDLKNMDLQNAKKRWADRNEYDKAVDKRNMIEFFVVIVMLGLLGPWVLDSDDDDEDTYAEDFARLIYLRTTSEMVTQTGLGILPAIEERIKQPVPMWKWVDFALTLKDNLFDETTEGENKAWSKFKKLTILRRKDQLNDLQEQIDAFRYFNDPTLYNLGSVEDKKDEMYNKNQQAYDNLRVN